MKKIISLIIICMLLFTACSQGVKSEAVNENKGTENNETPNEVLKADIVVIGAGGAGMTAAIEAHDAGAKVIVVEKMPFAGGNSVRSKGGLNAAETSVQKKLNIEDSIDTFYDDTIKGGKELNDPELVKYFAENSAEAVDWLLSIGMDISDVAPGAGATNPRMHRPSKGADVGPVLVKTLSNNIKERNIEVLYNIKATEITSENNKVTGIKALDTTNNKEIIIQADAVVIATGGFAANEELYTKYREDLKGFVTTNHAGATGDGIMMAEALGAALIDMDQIQTNPTVEQESTEVISESVRGLGAIFVNQSGKRFTSEMLTRDVLSAKILEQEGKYTYIIFDQKLRENMVAVEGMIKRGIVTEGATLEELADKLKMDGATLVETIEKWNLAVANKADEEFQRETGMDNDLSKAPYYAIKVGPGVHHTMGGIKINTNTQVLKTDGSIIEGLYAAGETTGGVHGANRLGGNAVADIVIFGRQAGMKSAEFAIANGSLLTEGSNSEEDTKELSIKEGLDGMFKDGTYTAEAKGNNGLVEITVLVENSFITKIEATNHSETGPIFESVEEGLIPEIIYNQSVDVDTISGATNSSKAVLQAVKEIMDKAK